MADQDKTEAAHSVWEQQDAVKLHGIVEELRGTGFYNDDWDAEISQMCDRLTAIADEMAGNA